MSIFRKKPVSAARVAELRARWSDWMTLQGTDREDPAAIREDLVRFVAQNSLTKHEVHAMLEKELST